MGKVFITGDKHGSYEKLSAQLVALQTTKDDVVIVLGDHGTLYYGPRDDKRKKKMVANLPATFIMVRGNHDRRASSEEYNHQLIQITEPLYEGSFYVDPDYPSILYTTEYGWYRFGSRRVFVINGAYSVDKYRRLEMQAIGLSQYHWFADEQLDAYEQHDAIKLYSEREPADEPIYIMTHTCPLKYKPWDKLMGCVDQSTVDESMEKFLDLIDMCSLYEKWYCGHWHIDRSVDSMRFMYDDLELFDEINTQKETVHESISE